MYLVQIQSTCVSQKATTVSVPGTLTDTPLPTCSLFATITIAALNIETWVHTAQHVAGMQ